MNNKKLNISIIEHLNIINSNSTNLFKSFPNLYLAIEIINDIFDQLFVEQYRSVKGEEWELSIPELIFGAHSSIIQGIIMTSAGFNETGLTCVRRSIEYACYASKIKGSDERNKIWQSKVIEPEKENLFISKFLIPQTYFTDKYIHLRFLLVWHDFASSFGAHGNFTTLSGKWDTSYREGLRMSFHDNPERIPLSTGVIVRISYFILKAFIEGFKDNLYDCNKCFENLRTAEEIINAARIEILDYACSGNMPLTEIKSIFSKEDPAIEEMFIKLKEKYEKLKPHK